MESEMIRSENFADKGFTKPKRNLVLKKYELETHIQIIKLRNNKLSELC